MSWLRNSSVQLLKDILLAYEDGADEEANEGGATGGSVPVAPETTAAGGAASQELGSVIEKRPMLEMGAVESEWPPKAWLPKTNIQRWTTPGPRDWSALKDRCVARSW